MKSSKRLILVILLSCLVTVAKSDIARAQNDGDKIDLRLHLQEGKSYNLTSFVDQQITQTIQGQKLNMIQTIAMGYVFDVTNVDADGTATAKVTYNSVQFRNQGPLGIIDYDSDDPPKQIPPMAKGFAAIVGESFTLKISPIGKIVDVQGVDKMMQKVVAKLDIPKGPERTALEESLKSQFGDHAIKTSMEGMMAIYPDKPVGIGDSWSKRIVIEKGFPMILENTWTLKSRKDGVAAIDVKTTIRPNPNATPVQMGVMKMRYSISGDQQGTLEMEENSGWVVRGRMTQKSAGQIRILGNPQAPQGSSWPITIKTLVRLDSEAGAHNTKPTSTPAGQ